MSLTLYLNANGEKNYELGGPYSYWWAVLGMEFVISQLKNNLDKFNP